MGIKEVLTDITRDVVRNGREAAENKRMTTNAPFLAGRASVKTIAGGAIEVTRPHVVVLPESGIADNLDEITNYADGKFIIVSPADPAHTITVRDESVSGGNIRLSGGATTLALSGPEETILLIYKDEVSLWVQTGGAASGGAPGAHAASHQHGGSDEVATSTPAANAIVKADGDSKIGAGWIDDADINLDNVTEGATNKFYTATEKTKLAGIADGAEVNVNADWNAVGGDALILNKPTIPTQYTDEMAQDTVGGILVDSATLDFTYDDATPSITAIVKDDSVSNAKLANMAVNTVKGRITAGTGDPEDLTATQVRTIINVEDGADVTDAANVLAAGAVMVTGDQNVAGEKSFTSTVILAVLEALSDAGITIQDNAGNLAIFVEDGGFVGINTTNPANRLHVVETVVDANAAFLEVNATDAAIPRGMNVLNKDASADSFTGMRFDFVSSDGVSTARGAAFGVGKEQLYTGVTTTRDGYFTFMTATNGILGERMRISSDGKVGIGIFPATSFLHVQQSAATGNALRVIRDLAAASTDSPLVDMVQDNASDDQGALRVQQDGTGYIVEFYDGATLVWRLNDGGRLDVAQIIRALTASGLRLEDDGGNLGIAIEDGGQVGVRQATPDASLHVLEPTLGQKVFAQESEATNDNVLEWTEHGRVATTDATPTTLHTIPITANRTYMIEAKVKARRTGGSAGTADDGAAYRLASSFNTKVGVVTLIGIMENIVTENVAGYAVALVISGSNVIVQVTGVANTNITWHAIVTISYVGS